MKKVAVVYTGDQARNRFGLLECDYEFAIRVRKCLSEPCLFRHNAVIVKSSEEALAHVTGSMVQGLIVYVQDEMADEARRVANEHPRLRVVLFAESIPQGEVIHMSHHWVNDDECHVIRLANLG